MVRISDILKKKMEAKEPEKPKAPKPEPPPPVPAEAPPVETPPAQFSQAAVQKEIPAPEAVAQRKEQKPQEMQIAKAMKEIQPDKARSQNHYLAGIQLAKDILNNIRQKLPFDFGQVKEWISSLVGLLVLKDTELARLFYEQSQENYLYSHMVNVPIMSILVGLDLGYNKSKLNELGLAAFLHDIGMIKVEKIYLEPRPLSDEEYNQIKEHPVYGIEILAKIKDIPEPVIYAVKEIHERVNGTGYPSGSKDGEISEYGRIIGLVDVYEALTHNRPHRKRYLPHEAIREMITGSNSLFEAGILKLLINQVGVYPIGSYAELNTEEVVKVVNINNDFPLRPVVNIIFDVRKKRLTEPRLVNLAKEFNLFIKRPLSSDEVAELIK